MNSYTLADKIRLNRLSQSTYLVLSDEEKLYIEMALLLNDSYKSERLILMSEIERLKKTLNEINGILAADSKRESS